MGATWVTLGWTPNYEGGMPRGYTVRFRAAGSLEYQVSVLGAYMLGRDMGLRIWVREMGYGETDSDVGSGILS